VATILSPEAKTSFGVGLIQSTPKDESSSSESVQVAYAEWDHSNTDAAALDRRSNRLGLGLSMFTSGWEHLIDCGSREEGLRVQLCHTRGCLGLNMRSASSLEQALAPLFCERSTGNASM
jgi:hypothetical protein